MSILTLAIVSTFIIIMFCLWLTEGIIRRLVLAIRELAYEDIKVYVVYLGCVAIMIVLSVRFLLVGSYSAVFSLVVGIFLLTLITALTHWFRGGE